MFESPAPSMPHSLSGLPGFWFSRTIGLVAAAAAKKFDEASAESGFDLRSHRRSDRAGQNSDLPRHRTGGGLSAVRAAARSNLPQGQPAATTLDRSSSRRGSGSDRSTRNRLRRAFPPRQLTAQWQHVARSLTEKLRRTIDVAAHPATEGGIGLGNRQICCRHRGADNVRGQLRRRSRLKDDDTA